jgi:hypothetical protein
MVAKIVYNKLTIYTCFQIQIKGGANDDAEKAKAHAAHTEQAPAQHCGDAEGDS